MLLEVYLSLILIFATGYAILQASSLEPAFSGMPVLRVRCVSSVAEETGKPVGARALTGALRMRSPSLDH